MKKGILIILFLALLTGCSTTHSYSDVDTYIKDEIGLSNYELSSESKDVLDSDGVVDKYWRVDYKDIEFDVIDNFHKNSDVKNNLEDTYYESLFSLYLSKLEKRSFNFEEVLEKKKFTCNVANYEKEINYDRMKECYDSLYEFLTSIDTSIYPLKNDIEVYARNSTTVADVFYIYENEKIKTYDEFIKK